jgi:hypothetical protein
MSVWVLSLITKWPSLSWVWVWRLQHFCSVELPIHTTCMHVFAIMEVRTQWIIILGINIWIIMVVPDLHLESVCSEIHIHSICGRMVLLIWSQWIMQNYIRTLFISSSSAARWASGPFCYWSWFSNLCLGPPASLYPGVLCCIILWAILLCSIHRRCHKICLYTVQLI